MNRLAYSKILLYVFLLTVSVLVLQTTLEHYAHKQKLLFDNGQPLGGDYIAFYTGGSLYVDDPTTLYNLDRQWDFQKDFWVKSSVERKVPFLPFVYPPFVAWSMSFLTHYSYEHSFFVWSLLSLSLALLSVELLIRASDSKIPRLYAYLLLGAYTPFSISTLSGGQLSSIGLLVISLMYYLLCREKDFCAGLVTGMATYKPPLFLLLLLYLSFRSLRFFYGALLGILFILISGLVLFGMEQYSDYVVMVVQYLTGEVELIHFQLPATLNVGIVGVIIHRDLSKLSLLLVFLILYYLFVMLKRGRQFHRTYSLWLLFSVLFSFQVNEYDLTLLLFPLLFLYPELFEKESFAPEKSDTVGE